MTSASASSQVRKRKLGDLFKIKHGHAFKGEYFSDSGPYVVLTPGNFHDEGGFKKKSKEKYYTGEVPPGFILKRGDLIIAMTEQAEGLLGSSALVPENGLYLHNQRLGLVEDLADDIDKQFLYYLFNHRPVRQQIRASSSGVKVRHTSPSRVYEVTVGLPSLPAQENAAAILSAYDDLIENNIRRIKILEEIARLIYEEWFVTFRFLGHESVRMVDSKLGEIPEGWSVTSIRDVTEIHRGRSYKSKELVPEGGLPFFNLKCIDREGGFRLSGLKRYSGPFKETQRASKNDILVAVTDMTQERRIVARAARIPDFGEDSGVLSMDLVKVVPREVQPMFLYGLLRFSDFPDKTKQFANGANVLHLHPDRILDHRFALPPVSLRARYHNIAGQVYRLSDNLDSRIQRLRMTRDLLLPKLISGEIDVSDLNIQVEEAVA